VREANRTLADIREEALSASDAHLVKVSGRTPGGRRAAFTALVMEREDGSRFGYVEGGLRIPAEAYRQLNEFLQAYVWTGSGGELMIAPPKVLRYDGLRAYVTHQWTIVLPDDLENAEPASFDVQMSLFKPGFHRAEEEE